MLRNKYLKLNLLAKSARIALVAGLVLFSLGAVRAHAITTYYACVNNSTGAVVIVTASHTCSSSQHKISWNQTGPQGPSGAALGYAAKVDTTVHLKSQTVILSTPPVQQTGTYFVNASALLIIDSSDSRAGCAVMPKNSSRDGIIGESSATGYWQPVAISDFFSVTAGTPIELICASGTNDPNTLVPDAGLTAVLIQAGATSSSPTHAQSGLMEAPK